MRTSLFQGQHAVQKQPPEMFYEKAGLKDFTIFARKKLGQSRLSVLQLYFKKTPTRVFSCKYCEIFKNTYFEQHLQTAASCSAASFSIQLFSQITLIGCFFLFNEWFPFNFSSSSQFSWLTLNSKYSEIASCYIKLGRRKQIQFNQPKSKHLSKKFFLHNFATVQE